jgi:hypothetical protein
MSGVLAAVMVVALSVMAFSALQPAHEPSLRTAELDLRAPKIPELPRTVPDLGQTRAE